MGSARLALTQNGYVLLSPPKMVPAAAPATPEKPHDCVVFRAKIGFHNTSL